MMLWNFDKRKVSLRTYERSGVFVDNTQIREVAMVKISAVMFCMFLFLSSSAAGATKEVITTGKYVMGDLDTKTKAKKFALLDAKKLAMEKAGTYLRSFSEVDGLHLTRDEVLSLAAGTMSVEILEEMWEMQGQNPVITITIKAKIDTSDLDKEIEALIAHRTKLKSFNEMEKTGDGFDKPAYSKATIIDSFLDNEISITQVKNLINTGGLMEVQLTGVNNTSSYKKLEYRIEWFDKNGFLIDTIMSRWTEFPAYGNSEFGFRAVAPKAAAADFRIRIREED